MNCSIVMILGTDKTSVLGTGFYIGFSTNIITCAHVVKGFTDGSIIHMRRDDGYIFDGVLNKKDTRSDLALIETEASPDVESFIAYYTIHDELDHSHAEARGYDAALKCSHQQIKGIHANVLVDGFSGQYIQLDNANNICIGFSGAPLFNNGILIGIIDCFPNFFAHKGRQNNIAYAIPAQHICTSFKHLVLEQTDSLSGINRYSIWKASKTWLAAAESGDRRFFGWDIVENLFPVLKTGLGERLAATLQTTVNDPAADIQGANAVEIIRNSSEHFYLIGEGGIGKTTMLRQIMKEGLGDIYSLTGKVPVFIELASAPARECAAYEEGESTFILRSIYSLMHPDKKTSVPFKGMSRAFTLNADDTVTPVWEEFTRETDSPGYLLLLDGLNEVSRKEVNGYSVVSMIIREIQTIIRECSNVQVLLTSRSEENLGDGIRSLILEGITDKAIGGYLRGLPLGSGFTEDEIKDILTTEQLLSVLRIPLFLTMYAKLKNRSGILAGGELFRTFFHEKSEQLYNQRQRLVETNSRLDVRQMYFLLDIVLPEIGYEMEKEGDYEISGYRIKEILGHILDKYADADAGYTGYADHVFTQYLEPGDRKQKLSYTAKRLKGSGDLEDVKAMILDCVIEQLGILYESGDEVQERYSFRHQHFRDYFAAQRYINDLRVAVLAWETYLETRNSTCLTDAGHFLKAFRDNAISRPVRVFIGEILGEHHNTPEFDRKTGLLRYMVPKVGWIYRNHDQDISAAERDRNLIKKTFEILKGKQNGKSDYSIFNLVHILDDVRKDLSGSDLSRLDLTQVNLNGIKLGGPELAADLDKAIIDPNSFFCQGHTSTVVSAAFSPDGRLIVTASRDNTARIWDISTGQMIHLLEGHTGWVNSAVFSPDGRLVVTSSDDNTARIWDAATGLMLHSLEGHTGPVYNVAFSPDGRFVVTASGDSTARIWEAATGRMLHLLNGHTDWVNSAAFSPDGRFVVTASNDCTARIWEVVTGQMLHPFKGHNSTVNSASFSPDGRFVVTASNDDTARIWEAATGRMLHLLQGHTFTVNNAAFSPDGRLIVTASDDCTARIWEATTGRMLHLLDEHTSLVNSVAFSPDGRLVVTASGDGTTRIWEASTGLMRYSLQGYTGWVNNAVFSPDGRLVVTASGDGTAKIWDAATGLMLHPIQGHTGWVNSAVFSPDGRLVVTASSDRTARIWAAATGRMLHPLQGHTDPLNSAVLSPDGRFVVTASFDKTARIWEAATGRMLYSLQGHTRPVYNAAFSPDGRLVVTASSDRTARIWEAATGLMLHPLQGHTGPVYGAVFSPDSRLVVTASYDGTARIWEAATGRMLYSLREYTGWVNSAVFSPDGRLIITASYEDPTRIWEAATGLLLHLLQGHKGPVYSADFSPDSKLVVTASFDCTAKIWEAATGRMLYSLQGHTRPVNSAAFSPDGRLVVTASSDSTARIWEAATGQMLHLLEGHLDCVNSASFSPDGRFVVTASRDTTSRIWDTKTGKLLINLYHLAGFFLKGVKLNNSIMEPQITELQKDQLRQYGAII